MGIIAGATIGAGALLTFFFIALVFFLYRRRKGSESGPPTRTRLPHCPARADKPRGAPGPRAGRQKLAACIHLPFPVQVART